MCLTIRRYSENEPNTETCRVQNHAQEAGVYDSSYINGNMETKLVFLTVL